MKTIIALTTALLLSFVAPVSAAGPTPVSKKDRHEMMTKKKKNKKHKLFKNKMKRKRGHRDCNAPS